MIELVGLIVILYLFVALFEPITRFFLGIWNFVLNHWYLFVILVWLFRD